MNDKLIAEVRAHANTYRDEAVWSFVIENYDDADLHEIIGDAFTAVDAIERVSAKAEAAVTKELNEIGSKGFLSSDPF